MFNVSKPFDFYNSWMNYATAYGQMTMSAGEVIVRRTMQMSQGTMRPADAVGMVLEKASAFALSAEKAAITAANGGDPLKIATAALVPYGTKTRANVRKLRG